MNKLIFALTAIAMLGLSCRKNDNPVSPPIPEGYPHVLKFTSERYDTLMSKWKHFLETYNVTYFDPVIDSVLMVPLSFPTINLCSNCSDTISMEKAESLLTNFVNSWRDMLNADWSSNFTFTRQEYDNISRNYIFVIKEDYYTVKSYDFLHESFNYLSATISNQGVLGALRSHFAPHIFIPTKANINFTSAVQQINGKKITYDCTGIETLTISPQVFNKVQLAQVLIPRYSNGKVVSIEYRLCWEMDIGDLFTDYFSVYVDAITGEDIDYLEQHFICSHNKPK